ncbi:MAG TPA: hypothetical protein VGR57_09060 [Ktedonobacterales bacterium]|nr:hypothetical protein [Ktedonobacterales bacterium]
MRRRSNALIVALAALFVVAGAIHLVRPKLYLPIMPPALPCKPELILVSGVAEIAGGIGLLVPRVRRAAAWGLMALLVAVFPANIQMALNGFASGASLLVRALLLLRLPLQPALLWLVYRAGTAAGAGRLSAAEQAR